MQMERRLTAEGLWWTSKEAGQYQLGCPGGSVVVLVRPELADPKTIKHIQAGTLELMIYYKRWLVTKMFETEVDLQVTEGKSGTIPPTDNLGLIGTIRP